MTRGEWEALPLIKVNIVLDRGNGVLYREETRRDPQSGLALQLRRPIINTKEH